MARRLTLTSPLSDLGVSQNWGYHFRGPHNKDYSILGSILGSPHFGKLPFHNSRGNEKIILVVIVIIMFFLRSCVIVGRARDT